MPKSRGRRGRKSKRAQPRTSQAAGYSNARLLANLAVVRATDAAEAGGDARAALRMIESQLEPRGVAHFWRPERLERLRQLVGLASVLPRWATSRWILAQAAQALDERGHDRTAKALEVAVEARGGEAALVGADRVDAMARLLDHDWLFRQLFLYELGGLQHFLTRIASPDLLAAADRIDDWAKAPMGGFRLEFETSELLTWTDLATGREVDTVNLGTATLLGFEECVVGRLVPVEGGAMFEGAPLPVPDHVAEDVADNPSGWVDLVCDSCRDTAPEAVKPADMDFRLLTDVPFAVQRAVAAAGAVEAASNRSSGDQAAVGAGDLGAVALRAVETAALRAALDGHFDDLELPWNPWPSVAAMLLDPQGTVGFLECLHTSDAAKLRRMARSLAGPACDLCLALARELETAA